METQTTKSQNITTPTSRIFLSGLVLHNHFFVASQAKNAILSEDFVAGASPFSAHDVNSRAAQLGRSGQRRHVPNWERRNPNARAPPTGNKKRRK